MPGERQIENHDETAIQTFASAAFEKGCKETPLNTKAFCQALVHTVLAPCKFMCCFHRPHFRNYKFRANLCVALLPPTSFSQLPILLVVSDRQSPTGNRQSVLASRLNYFTLLALFALLVQPSKQDVCIPSGWGKSNEGRSTTNMRSVIDCRRSAHGEFRSMF